VAVHASSITAELDQKSIWEVLTDARLQKQVVNVAQRGGMCGVMIGHPPVRLYGPSSPAN
jgi:hypothetical protein